MPDFYVAYADQNGNRITASERQLVPGPTRVEYPTEPTGTLQETADGRVIQQQTTKDNRKRAWIWVGYPEALSGDRYRDLWKLLESLRSRYRLAYGAATPYVYLKDATSQEFRRLVSDTGTATSGGASTLTDTGQSWTTNAYAGYEVEVVEGTGAGQVRTVVSNTATQLTVSPNWTVNPASGSKYAVRGWVNDWFRCRVLEVSRRANDGGGQLKFEETKLVFVMEDTGWNYLG